jgi:hypothetical protein
MKAKHDKRPHQDPSTDRTRSGPGHASNKAPAAVSNSGVQGEGDYEAARVFNEAERKFVASGKVPAAARAAAPKSEAERQAMLAAEQEGKRRAKDKIPASPAAIPARGAEGGVNAPRRKGS